MNIGMVFVWFYDDTDKRSLHPKRVCRKYLIRGVEDERFELVNVFCIFLLYFDFVS